MMHVYPLNDLKEHDLESTTCACGPKVQWEDPETGESLSEALVIHEAFDSRHIIEQAEEIANNANSYQ